VKYENKGGLGNWLWGRLNSEKGGLSPVDLAWHLATGMTAAVSPVKRRTAGDRLGREAVGVRNLLSKLRIQIQIRWLKADCSIAGL